MAGIRLCSGVADEKMWQARKKSLISADI